VIVYGATIALEKAPRIQSLCIRGDVCD
jgi:hypothetical protein